MYEKNEDMERFIHDVCRHIYVPQYARRVKRELRDHLTCSALSIQAQQRISAEAAMQAAIARMGDPQEIGKQIAIGGQPVRRLLMAVACVLLWIAILWCVFAIFRTVGGWI